MSSENVIRRAVDTLTRNVEYRYISNDIYDIFAKSRKRLGSEFCLGELSDQYRKSDDLPVWLPREREREKAGSKPEIILIRRGGSMPKDTIGGEGEGERGLECGSDSRARTRADVIDSDGVLHPREGLSYIVVHRQRRARERL